ncbi:hypothetical protein LCGC14_0396480 [marine sediment metagenome]|uniref:Uncharacterized protein n=1 Tax=marine sediment metagenome TaxID=412755 RepID=A0A0F9VK27_9ZZZZ
MGDISGIPTADLVRELRRRKDNTYSEDTEFLRQTRGRGNYSKSAQLLLELKVGDVKRIYHEDVYCHHNLIKGKAYKAYICGLHSKREVLKKQGITFNIYHEKEHVAVVARIT